MWTEDKDRLLEMYAEGGCSATDAARVLGKSRSAVLGRAWRIGVKFNCVDHGERIRAGRLARKAAMAKE